MLKEERPGEKMRANPLSGIAMIGADLRKDFDAVEDSLHQVFDSEDRALIDSRDRAVAFRRAESVRILGGDDVDVMVASMISFTKPSRPKRAFRTRDA